MENIRLSDFVSQCADALRKIVDKAETQLRVPCYQQRLLDIRTDVDAFSTKTTPVGLVGPVGNHPLMGEKVALAAAQLFYNRASSDIETLVELDGTVSMSLDRSKTEQEARHLAGCADLVR